MRHSKTTCFTLLTTLALTACGSPSPANMDPKPHSVFPSKVATIKTAPKPTSPKVAQGPLTAEEKEIQQLLEAAKNRQVQKLKSQKLAADFHYRMAIKTYNGSVGQGIDQKSRVTDLNSARDHLVSSLNFVPGHKASRNLLIKVESLLGVPESSNRAILERASKLHVAENQQKSAEWRVKLAEAQKLMDQKKYDQAIERLQALGQELND